MEDLKPLDDDWGIEKVHIPLGRDAYMRDLLRMAKLCTVNAPVRIFDTPICLAAIQKYSDSYFLSLEPKEEGLAEIGFKIFKRGSRAEFSKDLLFKVGETLVPIEISDEVYSNDPILSDVYNFLLTMTANISIEDVELSFQVCYENCMDEFLNNYR